MKTPEDNTVSSAPVISIVMATYNGEPYIIEQLDSIAAQTRPFDELLIRDDGSSDGTVEKIREWTAAHPEVPVRILESSGNLGFIRNFSTLLEHTKGDYIFLCDQDDRWHPEKIEKMMAVMEQNPQAGLIASSFEFMNQDSELFYVPPIRGWTNQNLLYLPRYNQGGLNPISLDMILLHNGFQGCSMVLRRDIAKQYVKDENYILPHDWQLALLAALKEGLYYLDERLFDYRIHSSNTTSLPQAQPRNLFEKISRTLDFYYRSAPFRDRRDMLRSLRVTAPELWNPQREADMRFYDQYLQAIEKKSLRDYMALMSQPERNCLSYKDRISGYLYVCFGHRRQDKEPKAKSSSR